MKKAIIGLLLTSAFAFARDHKAVTQDRDSAAQQEHMAWYTKQALHTQSPPIHLAKVRHNEVVRQGDQININKTTITAFVSSNK